jgi:hypothetical protein
VATDAENLRAVVDQAIQASQHPYWRQPEFWIATVLTVVGVLLSAFAAYEAREAKRAANRAGRYVKLQSVTIELTEVAQKLAQIEPEALYREVRDQLQEITRKIRRVIAPYVQEANLRTAIDAVYAALDAAQEALHAVRPSPPAKEGEVPNAVYLAMEGQFASINNALADLIGLFEMKTVDQGDAHGQ